MECIKKREIIKFLKLISEFGKDIEFHYYSLNDDIYYDDFEEIDEEIVILRKKLLMIVIRQLKIIKK